MVAALKQYVTNGGKLLLTGAAVYDRFGEDFLGVTAGTLVAETTYHLPAADGATAFYSSAWRLVETTKARGILSLGITPLLDEYLLANPGAAINRYGKGQVLYLPADIFRDFAHNRTRLPAR